MTYLLLTEYVRPKYGLTTQNRAGAKFKTAILLRLPGAQMARHTNLSLETGLATVILRQSRRISIGKWL